MTYGERTIRAAINSPHDVYDPNYRSETQSDSKKEEKDDGFTPELVMGLHQGETHYWCNMKDGENFTQNQLSSFIIIPKQRVWLDGKENLTVDFVSPEKTYPDVVIRRRDWNGNDRFMDAFPSIDLQWYGKVSDVQCVHAMVAQYKIPVKQGTTQLGRQSNSLWVLPDGAFDNNG